MAGAPACTDVAGLLTLRPLVRRKKRPAEDDERAAAAAHGSPRRRLVLGAPNFSSTRGPLRRARAESSGSIDGFRLADAAKCLLSMTGGSTISAGGA